MHLADAVPVVVPRPLSRRMTDRGMSAAHRRELVIPRPFVRVDRDHRPRRPTYHVLQRRAVSVLGDAQADLTALPAHHSADRRAVVGPSAVAAGLVRPPTRRIVRVAVRHAFFPPRSGRSRRPPKPGRPGATGLDPGTPGLAVGA